MIMTELDRIPVDKCNGPVLVCEFTGRPSRQNNFRIRWRQAGTAAGVPATVFNIDSRTGGITETIEATGGNDERKPSIPTSKSPWATADARPKPSRKTRSPNSELELPIEQVVNYA